MSDNTEPDNRTIEDLLHQWIPPLYGFALQKTGRLDEAEDLAGRMVEGLYRSLLVSGLPDCPSAYVWRLARNHWARWLRDRSRRPETECFDEGSHSPRQQHDPADQLVQQETMGLLRREIAWLSRVQRQVVLLHYFESRPVSDIAQTLALPAGTVKWHLSAARQELRKGMEIMRSVGHLGIQPIKFSGGVWLNGDPGQEKLNQYTDRRLSQNVIYACYHQERTLEEIAAELGLSPVYVEDEVASLADFGILEPLRAGRYRAQICLTEWTPALVDRITRLYQDTAPRLARELAGPLLAQAAAFRQSGLVYPDQDWNTLLWTLVPLAVNALNLRQPDANAVDRFRTPRPDGGRYLISATLAPAGDAGAAGCLSTRYSLNGPMHHHATQTMDGAMAPAWYTWRIDTPWNGRRQNPQSWDQMQQDYAQLWRHLKGQLSPDYNADEYRRLLELEYLRRSPGGFEPNPVLVPGGLVAQNLFDLLSAGNRSAIDQLVAEFNAAWLDIMLPTYPAHIRPMARAQFGNEATTNRMTAFLLEHLLQTGSLQELRPEHRLASQLILFLDCPKGYWDLFMQ